MPPVQEDQWRWLAERGSDHSMVGVSSGRWDGANVCDAELAGHEPGYDGRLAVWRRWHARYDITHSPIHTSTTSPLLETPMTVLIRCALVGFVW